MWLSSSSARNGSIMGSPVARVGRLPSTAREVNPFSLAREPGASLALVAFLLA